MKSDKLREFRQAAYKLLAGKAEGRGQKAFMDLSLPRNGRTLWATGGSQGFKPPTKISDLVACNQCGSQNRLLQLTKTGAKSTPAHLSRLDELRRYAILVAFLIEWSASLGFLRT